MALPDGAPKVDLLEGEGFETWQDVVDASDEELLAIEGIGPASLKEIRAFDPNSPAGAGSGATTTSAGGSSKNISTKSEAGEDLPKGVVRNTQSGTYTATSEVDKPPPTEEE